MAPRRPGLLTRLREPIVRKGQRIVGSAVALLVRWGDKKRESAEVFEWIVHGLATIVTVLILNIFFKMGEHPPEGYELTWLGRHAVPYSWTLKFYEGLIVYPSVFLLLRVVLPMLFYMPHAIAMRSMGLVRAHTETDQGNRVIEELLLEHPDKKDIRIICISGHDLFRTSESPLRKMADQGRLRVLLPSITKVNPTVRRRYETYDPTFRDDQYPVIERLLDEITDSKNFLVEHPKNRVRHHNAVCLWRVILFEEKCVVQTYFPNFAGRDSRAAPVFVFEKGDAEHSHYRTFDCMFNYLWEEAQA